MLRVVLDVNVLVSGLLDRPGPPGDPDDDYLVALAFAAEAGVIVTGDKDLLELGLERPRIVAPREFRGWLADVP